MKRVKKYDLFSFVTGEKQEDIFVILRTVQLDFI
jgi:hypothetical protein